MQFQVCAHRGASGSHPENTLAAFATARELGVERMEFDVRRTQDGHLVVIHDPTVNRTTNGSGSLWELTFCAVRSLDAGSHKGAEFASEKIPTFEETLDACPMICNVNLYPGPHDLELIIDEVVQTLVDKGRLGDSFIAADMAVIDRVAEVKPDLACCLLGNWAANPDYPQISLDHGCLILQPSNKIVTPEHCAKAHELGQTVHPFFADDAAEMKRLIECGVDGILTNEPALLQQVLQGG